MLRYYIVFAVFLFLGFSRLSANEAERVVILANSNVPESMEVARYYASSRSIPKENIVTLPMPEAETVSVRDYVDTIYNPLLAKLNNNGWVKGVRSRSADPVGRRRMSVALHSISYLVTTLGVPLRIANDPTLLEPGIASEASILEVNCGSVDSELSVLAVPGKLPMTALVENPFFKKKGQAVYNTEGHMRVCRLDGPSVVAVKRLIDRSLQAERQGLQGRAYFDLGGPHKQGDEWFKQAAELAMAADFDTEIESERRLMDYRDRLDAPAIYMGWYRHKASGPWAEKQWAVPPGALGFHLHSFSATTVRSARSGWVGPLVSQGYCMTIGNVYEPYLEFTHRPHLLLEHLLAGGTFGEAAAYAYPVASWMGIAVGDPLFRPFAKSLDDQLATDAVAGAFSPYLYLRQINRLIRQKGRSAALIYARECFLKAPSLPLAYRLGNLYEEGEQVEKALEVLKFVRFLDHYPKEKRILLKKMADLLFHMGHSQTAFLVYKKLLEEEGLPKPLRILLLTEGSKIAEEAGEPTVSARWASKAMQLKQPPAEKDAAVGKK